MKMGTTSSNAQTVVFDVVEEPNALTRKVLEDTDAGRNIVGPFSNAFDFWNDLEEDEAWEDL